MINNRSILTMITVLGLGIPAFAQNNPVHVKMIRVIDGDSTVIEKDIDESQLPAMEKELGDAKGKDVKVMMFVEKGDAGDRKMKDHSFRFDFNDSLPSGCKMIRKEIINGNDTMVFMMPDMHEKFLLPDSMAKGNAFIFGAPGDNDDFFDLRFPGENEDFFKLTLPGNKFEFNFPDEKEIEKIMNGFSYDYKIEDDNGKQRVIIRSIGPDSTGKMVIKSLKESRAISSGMMRSLAHPMGKE